MSKKITLHTKEIRRESGTNWLTIYDVEKIKEKGSLLWFLRSNDVDLCFPLKEVSYLEVEEFND